MPSLLDIPAELCEEILSHLIKASHLASAALVSKTFHEYSIPLLYEQVYIYHWHGNSKARVRVAPRVLFRITTVAVIAFIYEWSVGGSTLYHPLTQCASGLLRQEAR